MAYKEISISTNALTEDLVSDLLISLGSEGTSIVDPNDIEFVKQNDVTWDFVDNSLLENKDEVIVKGFFNEISEKLLNNISQGLERIKDNSSWDVGSFSVFTKTIDEDFLSTWKKYYVPININKVVVCPIWIEDKSFPGKELVLINPNMAFGTGQHETTSMCIELLQNIDLIEKDIIDLGCGSGILGITAIKLGAKKAYCIDFDPLATKATLENGKLNCVEDKLDIKTSSFFDSNPPASDVILANLTFDLLSKCIDEFNNHIKDNGFVIISGILDYQEEKVIEMFKKIGYENQKVLHQKDWVGLLFKKL